MNPFALIEGMDFDTLGSSIQCRADRDGATVHTIDLGKYQVRVLAHTDLEADESAREHLEMLHRKSNDAQVDAGNLDL